MPAEMCLGEPVAVKWPFSSVSSCAQAVGGSGETVKSLQGWCLAPRPSKQRLPAAFQEGGCSVLDTIQPP